MKIKFIALCICSILALTFTACSDNTKVIEGEVKTIQMENSETEPIITSETQEKETTPDEDEQYKGYAFAYQNVVVEIDAEAAPIIEKLGEANSYFEAPSCAFEGIDKMYGYHSFEVDTYPLKDKDYISAIIFKDDTITTAEGVGIGDTIDKVTEIYGNDGSNEDGMLVFEKDKVKLCFIVQDNSVASIEYRSTVLDE